MDSGIHASTTKLKSHLMRAALSRSASLLLLGAFFWMAAAAGFSGFLGKWGLMGDAGVDVEKQRYGLGLMLDATAHKPFVYRQLAPMIAKAADEITPGRVNFYARKYLMPKREFSNLISPPPQELRFQFIVIYYLSFLSLFASLFVLRRVLLDFGIDRIVATVVPAAMALALPYIQTVGGFFYDNIELFFMSSAFLAASRGKVLWLIALVLPATFNKETFLFFLPTLFPLLRHRSSTKSAAVVTSLAILLAGLVNVAVKLTFAGSPRGVVAELHWLQNLKYYLSPTSYLRFVEITYGVIGPERVFFGTLLVIGILVLRGWGLAPLQVRRHLLIAAAINVPLFLLFCAAGELRNLSLLYVSLVIMAGFAIDRGGKRAIAGNERP